MKRPAKILERPAYNEGAPEATEDKYTMYMKKLAKSVTKSLEATVQTNPSSTKAVALSQQKRRAELQEKRTREEAAKKEDADRVAKQNAMKGTVQGALKAKFGKSASQIIHEQARERRDTAKKSELKMKEELQAAIARGQNRPMLLEQSAADHAASSNLAFLKAAQKMVDILKSQGENPDHYLTEQQKEVLEDETLRASLKAKYKK